MSGNNHIVWDLDDTLVHTIFLTDAQVSTLEVDPTYKFLKDRSVIRKIVDIRDDGEIGRGDIANALVIFRPGAKEIVNYCLDNFKDVTFWSAGHKRYVRMVVSLLVDPGHKRYINSKIKVLTRQDCNEITGTTVLKDLNSKGFDLSKSIIVDDNKTTYRNNEKNAIPIESYNPEVKKEHIEYQDQTLYQLLEWLKKTDLRSVPDVRLVDKTEIYTTKHL